MAFKNSEEDNLWSSSSTKPFLLPTPNKEPLLSLPPTKPRHSLCYSLAQPHQMSRLKNRNFLKSGKYNRSHNKAFGFSDCKYFGRQNVSCSEPNNNRFERNKTNAKSDVTGEVVNKEPQNFHSKVSEVSGTPAYQSVNSKSKPETLAGNAEEKKNSMSACLMSISDVVSSVLKSIRSEVEQAEMKKSLRETKACEKPKRKVESSECTKTVDSQLKPEFCSQNNNKKQVFEYGHLSMHTSENSKNPNEGERISTRNTCGQKNLSSHRNKNHIQLKDACNSGQHRLSKHPKDLQRNKQTFENSSDASFIVSKTEKTNDLDIKTKNIAVEKVNKKVDQSHVREEYTQISHHNSVDIANEKSSENKQAQLGKTHSKHVQFSDSVLTVEKNGSVAVRKIIDRKGYREALSIIDAERRIRKHQKELQRKIAGIKSDSGSVLKNISKTNGAQREKKNSSVQKTENLCRHSAKSQSKAVQKTQDFHKGISNRTNTLHRDEFKSKAKLTKEEVSKALKALPKEKTDGAPVKNTKENCKPALDLNKRCASINDKVKSQAEHKITAIQLPKKNIDSQSSANNSKSNFLCNNLGLIRKAATTPTNQKDGSRVKSKNLYEKVNLLEKKSLGYVAPDIKCQRQQTAGKSKLYQQSTSGVGNILNGLNKLTKDAETDSLKRKTSDKDLDALRKVLQSKPMESVTQKQKRQKLSSDQATKSLEQKKLSVDRQKNEILKNKAVAINEVKSTFSGVGHSLKSKCSLKEVLNTSALMNSQQPSKNVSSIKSGLETSILLKSSKRKASVTDHCYVDGIVKKRCKDIDSNQLNSSFDRKNRIADRLKSEVRISDVTAKKPHQTGSNSKEASLPPPDGGKSIPVITSDRNQKEIFDNFADTWYGTKGQSCTIQASHSEVPRMRTTSLKEKSDRNLDLPRNLENNLSHSPVTCQSSDALRAQTYVPPPQTPVPWHNVLPVFSITEKMNQSTENTSFSTSQPYRQAPSFISNTGTSMIRVNPKQASFDSLNAPCSLSSISEGKGTNATCAAVSVPEQITPFRQPVNVPPPYLPLYSNEVGLSGQMNHINGSYINNQNHYMNGSYFNNQTPDHFHREYFDSSKYPCGANNSMCGHLLPNHNSIHTPIYQTTGIPYWQYSEIQQSCYFFMAPNTRNFNDIHPSSDGFHCGMNSWDIQEYPTRLSSTDKEYEDLEVLHLATSKTDNITDVEKQQNCVSMAMSSKPGERLNRENPPCLVAEPVAECANPGYSKQDNASSSHEISPLLTPDLELFLDQYLLKNGLDTKCIKELDIKDLSELENSAGQVKLLDKSKENAKENAVIIEKANKKEKSKKGNGGKHLHSLIPPRTYSREDQLFKTAEEFLKKSKSGEKSKRKRNTLESKRIQAFKTGLSQNVYNTSEQKRTSESHCKSTVNKACIGSNEQEICKQTYTKNLNSSYDDSVCKESHGMKMHMLKDGIDEEKKSSETETVSEIREKLKSDSSLSTFVPEHQRRDFKCKDTDHSKNSNADDTIVSRDIQVNSSEYKLDRMRRVSNTFSKNEKICQLKQVKSDENPHAGRDRKHCNNSHSTKTDCKTGTNSSSKTNNKKTEHNRNENDMPVLEKQISSKSVFVKTYRRYTSDVEKRNEKVKELIEKPKTNKKHNDHDVGSEKLPKFSSLDRHSDKSVPNRDKVGHEKPVSLQCKNANNSRETNVKTGNKKCETKPLSKENIPKNLKTTDTICNDDKIRKSEAKQTRLSLISSRSQSKEERKDKENSSMSTRKSGSSHVVDNRAADQIGKLSDIQRQKDKERMTKDNTLDLKETVNKTIDSENKMKENKVQKLGASNIKLFEREVNNKKTEVMDKKLQEKGMKTDQNKEFKRIRHQNRKDSCSMKIDKKHANEIENNSEKRILDEKKTSIESGHTMDKCNSKNTPGDTENERKNSKGGIKRKFEDRKKDKEVDLQLAGKTKVTLPHKKQSKNLVTGSSSEFERRKPFFKLNLKSALPNAKEMTGEDIENFAKVYRKKLRTKDNKSPSKKREHAISASKHKEEIYKINVGGKRRGRKRNIVKSDLRVKLTDILNKSPERINHVKDKKNDKGISSESSLTDKQREERVPKTLLLKMGERKFLSEKMKQKYKLCNSLKKVSRNKAGRPKKTKTVPEKNASGCPICGKVMKNKLEINRHLKDIHPNRCGYCKIDFPSQESRRAHYWTHVKKQYSCHLCDIRCSTEYVYNLHMKSKKHEKVCQEQVSASGKKTRASDVPPDLKKEGLSNSDGAREWEKNHCTQTTDKQSCPVLRAYSLPVANCVASVEKTTNSVTCEPSTNVLQSSYSDFYTNPGQLWCDNVDVCNNAVELSVRQCHPNNSSVSSSNLKLLANVCSGSYESNCRYHNFIQTTISGSEVSNSNALWDCRQVGQSTLQSGLGQVDLFCDNNNSGYSWACTGDDSNMGHNWNSSWENDNCNKNRAEQYMPLGENNSSIYIKNTDCENNSSVYITNADCRNTLTQMETKPIYTEMETKLVGISDVSADNEELFKQSFQEYKAGSQYNEDIKLEYGQIVIENVETGYETASTDLESNSCLLRIANSFSLKEW